jgi:3-isopropylmalate/(R)-2-methylmalate dehydratase small subunit
MPEPFVKTTSRVIAIARSNIDTDQLCPARFLKITDKAGLADALFFDWRFTPDGARRVPPSFIDEPHNAGRQILLVGDNFGSGSSREHAPWALRAWGIRAIISTSFADIFKGNALKNALLPIVVSAERHAALQALVGADPDGAWTVDLDALTVTLPGGDSFAFEIDPFAQAMILAGTDEIGYVLAKLPAIEAWEATHAARVETRSEATTAR